MSEQKPEGCITLVDRILNGRPLVDIGDRSDIGPLIALWPSPQIPASVRSVEDSRILDYVEVK